MIAPLPPFAPFGFGQFPQPTWPSTIPTAPAVQPPPPASSQAAVPAPSPTALSPTEEQLLQLLRLLVERRDPSVNLLLQQLQSAPSGIPTSPAALPQPVTPTNAPGGGVLMRQQLGPNSADQQLSTGR